MYPVVLMNLLCAGIVLTCSLILFFLGNKILSTALQAVLWFYFFVFLLFNDIGNVDLLLNLRVNSYTHLFIPAFYSLSLFAYASKNKFNPLYLLVFIIPVIAIFFRDTQVHFFSEQILFSLVYHTLFWSILIILTVYFRIKERKTERNKLFKASFINFIILFITIYPTIMIYLNNYTNNLYGEVLTPLCIALAALLTLYFTYSDSLFVLNHQYYAGLDFLKKSSATEKRNILEKISAGLLHEIKNPITAIQSLNQQLLTNHSKMADVKIEEYLNIIMDELKRVKHLSESFLNTFRTSGDISKAENNIYEILSTVRELLMFEIQKKGVKITLDDSLLNKKVLFNNYQLRQVFLNLIYNSIEAGSKNIEIYFGKDENQMEIFIKDDGNGIADQERLFSPFYTTKLDGTGMGLVISREIMHENSGNLMLLSSREGETIFRIHFKNGGTE